MRAILIGFAIALPVVAQYYGLATSANGDVVYFSSDLVQPGSGQPQHSKIFRATEDGVTLVVSVERDEPPVVGSALVFSNAYLAANPKVDARGNLVAHDLGKTCRPIGIPCNAFNGWKTILGDRSFPGVGYLSRNGRYLASRSVSSSQSRDIIVTDLAVNQPGPRISGWYVRPDIAVGDDGSLMLLTRSDGFRWIPPGAGVDQGVVISDGFPLPLAIHQEDGETMTYFGGSARVTRVNPRTGERRQVPLPNGCGRLQVEPKSRIFAVCDNTQLVEFSGDGARVWTSDANGISAFVLASSLDVVWFSTGLGELKKFSLSKGTSVQVVRPVTMWFPEGATLVPGDIAWLQSLTGFHAGQGALEVRVNGVTAPVLAIGSNRMRFQVPWETQPGAASVEVRGLAESELGVLPSTGVSIAAFSPWIAQVDNKPAIVHGDWRGLVTEADPARYGEVVHVFLTGLGQVSPPWPAGQPAPSNAVHKVASSFYCEMSPYKSAAATPAEVLYAGLAPGTIGMFQVTFRIPPDGHSQFLNCPMSDGAGNRAAIEHYLQVRP